MIFKKHLLNFKNIGIVSHDIGGAHFVKAFLDEFKITPNFYCEGPAKSLFKINDLKESLEKFILNSDLIITGTSWSSDLEKLAIKISKENKIKCYTILDHWVNFESRFLLNKKFFLPDIIIVYDEKAYLLAKECLGSHKTLILKTKENLFLNKFSKSIKIFNNKHENRILFIDEPLKMHYEDKLNKGIEFLGYNEFIGFSEFIKKIKFSKFNEFFIDIKLHPSSNKNKYSKYLNKKVFLIDQSKNLEDVINKYKYIVGFTSMALFIAKNISQDNMVFSIIPKSINSKHIFDLKSFYDL